MHALLKEMAQADPADPWGDALSTHFAIADCLTVMGEDIPASWEYRPSPMLTGMTLADLDAAEEDYRTNYVAECVELGRITADDLRHAGNVLSRYTRILDRAGLSY